jgi:ATP-binding cassette, subfamily F, member 3
MAVLLQIKNACKSYGHQVLLDAAEATIIDDAKVGFVGRNGAGKSTLLRILLGEEELDQGEIVRHPKLQLGYLRQHDPFLPGETGLQFLMRSSGQPDWKCGEVAGEFELKGASLEGPIAQLSGGWQTRLKLAELLLHEPNLLLLDEPTNFLDLRTQILLEHFLRNHREACLVVSHDRAFLAATCDHTLDLSRGKLTMFPGKIDAFLEYQQEQREHEQRTNAATLAKRRHLEEFIAKNKARASTASRARSKSKQLERLELIETATDEPTANIRAPLVEPRNGPALRCRQLAIGYPDRRVADDISLEIDHGTRAAIVGDNGQGKTTFLRTVVDSLPALSGEVRWGYGCQLGIYAQHVYTSLPEEQTVLEYLERCAARGTKSQHILDLAGALLFRGEQIEKRIAVLSGGERARLCLAGLLLGNYNVLVLDEPGNHLDVDTVDALARALVDYRGTVVFTSHDRHFLKRVATSIVEVRDGRVVNYRGDYEAYLYSINQEIDDVEAQNHSPSSSSREGNTPPQRDNTLSRKGKPSASSLASKANKPPKHGERASQRDDRQQRKEMANLEKTISRLEAQKKSVHDQLLAVTDPAEALRLHHEFTTVTSDLQKAEERWLRLQEQNPEP